MDEDEQEVPAGTRWMVHALVLLATFVAGFGAGVLSDGTAEVINGFNASNRTSVQRAAPQPDHGRPEAERLNVTVPPSVVTDPVKTSPNGTIQWNVSVAPGTQLTELAIRSEGVKDPTRLRFYALRRGEAPTLVATMWIEGVAGAAISLPEGYYRVGSTRIREDMAWDSRAGDERYMDRPMRIDILDPDQSPPVLKVDAEGMMRSTASIAPSRAASRTRRTAKREREYEGLGRSSTDGGGDTYGQ